MDKHKPLGHQYQKKDKTIHTTKYSHIKKTIDSGTTARDVEVKSDKFIAKKRNENFGRLPARYLFTLLCLDKNTESIYDIVNENEELNKNFNNLRLQDDNMSQASYTSKQSSVTQTHKAEQSEGLLDDQSFLLLDIRDETDFSTYRIKEALCYPITNFKRDKTIPALFKFKNSADKIIIIYGNDEKQTITAGQIFFEKGYDNVYVLNKGIECFAMEYPQSIEGVIPEAVRNQIVQPEKKVFSRNAADTKTTMGITKTSVIGTKPSTANKTVRTPTSNSIQNGKENKPIFRG